MLSIMKARAKSYYINFGYKTCAALMRILNHDKAHDERFPLIPGLHLRYKYPPSLRLCLCSFANRKLTVRMDREKIQPETKLHDPVWRASCKELPWINTFEMGLFRHINLEHDRWHNAREEPNTDLVAILKVSPPPPP
jgi:hypothetical protein